MPDNTNNTKSIQREKVFYPQKGIHHGEQKHTGADPNTLPLETGKQTWHTSNGTPSFSSQNQGPL